MGNVRYRIGVTGTDASTPAGEALEATTLDAAHERAATLRQAIDEDYRMYPYVTKAGDRIASKDEAPDAQPRYRQGIVQITFSDGVLLQAWRAMGGKGWASA